MEKAKEKAQTLETRLLTLAKVYDAPIVVSILIEDDSIELLHTTPKKFAVDDGGDDVEPVKPVSHRPKLSSKMALSGEESAYANYFG